MKNLRGIHLSDVEVRDHRTLLPLLRFLSPVDLVLIEHISRRRLTIDDFCGAKRASDLGPATLELVRGLGAASPLLAARYLRELLPPTGLDGLLAIVEQLSADLSEVLAMCVVFTAETLWGLERTLGRRLTPADIVHVDHYAELPPRAIEIVRHCAKIDVFDALAYLREAMPHEHMIHKRFMYAVRDGDEARYMTPQDN